ncbi:hypothetical protein [Citrobacter koseri]|uniref:hypothetical protein n=1 Tax=Citrobacter koseri TaxID=545 RepID=UPI0039783498
MTNKPEQLTDLRALILCEIGDFFAGFGNPGEPETPEDMQRELTMRVGRIINDHIVNYPRCEALVEILRECRIARDEAQAELQERRKADSEEPVSFDKLNAAVAEVTGCNQHAWNANIYKGHQAVPFMNYNSLARIVDKYRAPQPAPVVPATLPCSVELKPGLIIGKGCKTETLLTALQRRADYYAEIDAMTPEERAEHDANIEAFKAMLPQPALDSKQVGELTMWVKRLAHSLRNARPDSKLHSDAMDYLCSKGLISVGDVLR